MTAIMNSACWWAEDKSFLLQGRTSWFLACSETVRGTYHRSGGSLGGWQSPPAIWPMVWPISRSLWIRFATDRTGSSAENGLILVSVPGR